MNLHTPQRLQDEDFEAYKIRRFQSKLSIKNMNKAPSGTMGSWFLGQHTATPERKAKRNLILALGSARQAKKYNRKLKQSQAK